MAAPRRGGSTVPQCQVCDVQPSKYKCPGCALRYCSVACCKTHKEASCPAGTAAGAMQQPPAGGRPQHHHQQQQWARKRGREDTRGAPPFHEEDDGDLPPLTPEMQAALRESKWLQGALGDSTLRRLLADIDGSSSATSGDAASSSSSSSLTGRDRAARLKEALAKYPDLQAFVDRMLMEVGALQYEDGRLVFT